MRLAPIWLLPALLAIPPACGTTAASAIERVNDDITHGRYEEAVRYAADLVESHPDDERAAELHRMASVAWMLERGRRLCFEDQDEEALAVFEEAGRIAPQDEIVRGWIEKLHGKLAARWLNHGLELHAEEDLEGAIDAYERALAYVPGDPSALSGMAQAVLQINHRKGLGESYYNDGMRALSRYWLQQARSRFAYSDKYEPESQRTERRLIQVNTLLADERIAIAARLEEDMLFGAARNEYRLALAFDPEHAAAREGLERTTVEAKASAKLSEARMAILRGHSEQAQALLDEGLALTKLQGDLFAGARAEIEEANLGRMYEEALNLEKDYLYPEAVAAYEAIIERAEYFRDALTRKETLSDYIRRAGELYAEAQAAQGDEKLRLLQTIENIWPEYRDVRAQIRELEQRP